jgi:hypothetical protein
LNISLFSPLFIRFDFDNACMSQEHAPRQHSIWLLGPGHRGYPLRMAAGQRRVITANINCAPGECYLA